MAADNRRVVSHIVEETPSQARSGRRISADPKRSSHRKERKQPLHVIPPFIWRNAASLVLHATTVVAAAKWRNPDSLRRRTPDLF
jgi:hypothetical protein